LKRRLEEAEEALRAIRNGEVDAIVVSGAYGEKVFSLAGADAIYRLIVETMKEAALTLALDGTVLYCNDQFGEFVKYPPEKILGRPFHEFVDADSRAAILPLVKAVQRHPVRQRLVFLDAGGQSRPAHITANALNASGEKSICMVAFDLAELERALSSLRESEGRYRTLFETIDQGFCMVKMLYDHGGKPVDYRFEEVNPAFENHTGLPRARGRTMRELVPTIEMSWVEAFGKVARTGEAAQIEGASDALGRFYDVFAFRIGQEDGTRVGILFKDITERKRAERELREAYELMETRITERTAELARSNKDLEAFAHVASHDLQEPLRMVSGFLSLLQEKYKGQLDETAESYIALTVDAASRMSALIHDLLAYARVNVEDRAAAPVDLAVVAKEAVANLLAAAQDSGAVITVDPLPTILADAGQMRQLFQNLLSNAIKYRAEGCRPEIHLGAERRGEDWLFHVQDNGIGIDPRLFNRLFQVFSRLHAREKYSGTGIGLAISKKIVEHHGGRIWVESEPGKGTTFWFSLPHVPPSRPPAGTPPDPAGFPGGRL
jgi:PAS domain S-box-containing protein